MTTTVDRLLAIAEHWHDLPTTEQDTLLGLALPHLDTPTARSYAEGAVEHLRAADDIRNGVGEWRTSLAEYIGDAETGREDAAEITAAEENARALMVWELDAAVAADLAALQRSQLDEAAEVLDTLTAPDLKAAADRWMNELPGRVTHALTGPGPGPESWDPFDVIERSDAAAAAFHRSPRGLVIGPAARTPARQDTSATPAAGSPLPAVADANAAARNAQPGGRYGHQPAPGHGFCPVCKHEVRFTKAGRPNPSHGPGNSCPGGRLREPVSA